MLGIIIHLQNWTWVLLRLFVYLGLAYLGIRYFEWKNVYHPSRIIEYTPSSAGLDYEDVAFVASDDVTLHGWWIPHPSARGSIIFFHGNAGNIGSRIWLAADLHKLGLNVFLFDYRGYGNSSGIPTEKGTYRDARAAYEFVRMKYDDDDAPPIVVYGRSLGGAIAMQCALDKPVRGLIVESTFASIPEMGRAMYPWLPIDLLCRYKYDNLAKAKDLRAPLLAAASRADTLVPYEQSRAVFDRAPDPKFWADLEGDHNDAGWESAPGYWEELKKFIELTLDPETRL